MYGKRILGSFGKSQVTNLAITSNIMKKGVIIHINMFSVRSFIEAKSVVTAIISLIYFLAWLCQLVQKPVEQ